MTAYRVIEVPIGAAGSRLDAFLARELRVPRRYAQRLIERGSVVPARKGVLLRAGEQIRVAPFRHPDEGPLPAPELGLTVLRESSGWVAVDKPAGLPSHPLDFDDRRSAVNAFLARHPDATAIGTDRLQCALVNRLDTLTSGVLLFATTPESWRAGRDAFDQGRAEKRYLARVHGALTHSLELRLELAHRGERMRVVERGGRATHTRVRPLAVQGDTTLLEIDLLTGARHQIRASLAHVGHAVVGDRLYGSTAKLPRHLLHAASLRIDGFVAHAPPPPELTPPSTS